MGIKLRVVNMRARAHARTRAHTYTLITVLTIILFIFFVAVKGTVTHKSEHKHICNVATS